MFFTIETIHGEDADFSDPLVRQKAMNSTEYTGPPTISEALIVFAPQYFVLQEDDPLGLNVAENKRAIMSSRGPYPWASPMKAVDRYF